MSEVAGDEQRDATGDAVEAGRGPEHSVIQFLKRKTGEAPQVTLLWGRLADVADGDRAALLVAMDALSDRMTAVIREQEGLAYRLGAGVRPIPGGAWILSATVGTRPENSERVDEPLETRGAGVVAGPQVTAGTGRSSGWALRHPPSVATACSPSPRFSNSRASEALVPVLPGSLAST